MRSASRALIVVLLAIAAALLAACGAHHDRPASSPTTTAAQRPASTPSTPSTGSTPTRPHPHATTCDSSAQLRDSETTALRDAANAFQHTLHPDWPNINAITQPKLGCVDDVQYVYAANVATTHAADAPETDPGCPVDLAVSARRSLPDGDWVVTSLGCVGDVSDICAATPIVLRDAWYPNSGTMRASCAWPATPNVPDQTSDACQTADVRIDRVDGPVACPEALMVWSLAIRHAPNRYGTELAGWSCTPRPSDKPPHATCSLGATDSAATPAAARVTFRATPR